MIVDLVPLSAKWIALKEKERLVTEDRRALEDKMVQLIGLGEIMEGKRYVLQSANYEIKILSRNVQKVDTDKLQDLAAANGLSDQLSYLFRWKPEVNTKNWNNADDKTKNFLSDAITTTPSRPSFSITPKEE